MYRLRLLLLTAALLGAAACADTPTALPAPSGEPSLDTPPAPPADTTGRGGGFSGSGG